MNLRNVDLSRTLTVAQVLDIVDRLVPREIKGYCEDCESEDFVLESTPDVRSFERRSFEREIIQELDA